MQLAEVSPWPEWAALHMIMISSETVKTCQVSTSVSHHAVQMYTCCCISQLDRISISFAMVILSVHSSIEMVLIVKIAASMQAPIIPDSQRDSPCQFSVLDARPHAGQPAGLLCLVRLQTLAVQVKGCSCLLHTHRTLTWEATVTFSGFSPSLPG